MPIVYFYASKANVGALTEWLSRDPQVVFVVGDGPGRWKTVDRLETLPEGGLSIWHLASGPLVTKNESGRFVEVPNPAGGWSEVKPGADCPATIRRAA